MSKVRVYEVARELGVENRDLIQRIATLGIQVRNHMSVLDPVEVDRIKRSLGKDRSEAMVEERIRPTVVRRKRRKKTEEAEQPAAAEAVRLKPRRFRPLQDQPSHPSQLRWTSFRSPCLRPNPSRRRRVRHRSPKLPRLPHPSRLERRASPSRRLPQGLPDRPPSRGASHMIRFRPASCVEARRRRRAPHRYLRVRVVASWQSTRPSESSTPRDVVRFEAVPPSVQRDARRDAPARSACNRARSRSRPRLRCRARRSA